MNGDTEREALIDTLVMTKLSDYAGQEMALINAAADRILAEFMPAHDKRVRAEQRKTDAHTVEKYQDKWWIAPDIAAAIREASDD